MSGKPKDFLGAFIVGGAIGVVGQLFSMLYTYLGVPPALTAILMLASISLISSILYVLGLYGKITFFGGIGAMMPFCGLPPSISMVFSQQLAEGKPLGRAVWASLKTAALIFAIGYAFCIAVALVMSSLAG